jgi:glycosyltransferase involved in cell wall biosynthesis
MAESPGQTLRVLMICPQFRPLVGGYERAAERLALGLISRGHFVRVVSERRDRAWPKRERVDGLEIERVYCQYRPGLHTVSTLLSLKAYLLRHMRGFDVVHVHQYGWPAAVASVLGLAFGVPVVLKLTNTGSKGIDAELPRGWAGALSRALHRRVAACFVTSERAAEEAVAFGIPRARVHRVPNPLDTDVFRPADAPLRALRREERGVGDAFLSLCVANIRPEKNHALLIDAWEAFVAARPGAPLVLAVLGDGPGAAALAQRVAASPAADSIRLLGRVEDVLPWYQAADLLVIASDAEGLSNSLMEALACGVPMLSTRVSGSEDVAAATDVGRLVPVGDVEALSQGLCTAYDEPALRQQWSEHARAYALDHYSIDVVVDAVERIYTGLCAARGA